MVMLRSSTVATVRFNEHTASTRCAEKNISAKEAQTMPWMDLKASNVSDFSQQGPLKWGLSAGAPAVNFEKLGRRVLFTNILLLM